jgi:uncharacterized protein (TIRG00374 family)
MSHNHDQIPRLPILRTVFSVLVLLAITLFVLINFAEIEQFVFLIRHVAYWPIVVAIVLQVLTYACSGGVWYFITKTYGYSLRFRDFAALSLQQLTVDQIVPAGGVAGNAFIYKRLRKLGLPNSLAMETVLIDLIAYHMVYSLMALSLVLVFWLYKDITPILAGIVSAYFLISVTVTSTILLTIFQKINNIPKWLKNRSVVKHFLEVSSGVSPDRVLSKTLLIRTASLRAIIFILDTLTLMLVLSAIGSELGIIESFAVFIFASIAGTITLMPGGIGGFEVGSATALIVFGETFETAVAATIIFRGLALWIPMIPGLYFTKKEIRFD